MVTNIKSDVVVSKTPQGQFAAETPDVSTPGYLLNWAWGTWLGNPVERYGYLAPSTNIPVGIKLQMLKHPILAMAAGFTGALLVKSERVIHCKDKEKQRFFDSLFRSWEQEFILQANVGIALGSIGLIKKWRFHVPEPLTVDAPPVWTKKATPYVVTGYDMTRPDESWPDFDDKGRHFQGIETPDGKVDVVFSLWLTFRQELAFGAYQGGGRLDHAYKDWWLSQFGSDLYAIAMQKEADRVPLVQYPPGVDEKSGRSNQEIALDIGDSVRSGATVAMPSEVYTTMDMTTGEERPTGVYKWSLEFLEGTGSFGKFHEIDDHHAQRMFLGYFIPPQTLMNVKQSALGGPTTADVLGEIAEDLLMQDAADIDRHLNEYVWPAISRANFPPTSPPVKVETVGIARQYLDKLHSTLEKLVGQHEDAAYFDMRAAMESLGYPLKAQEEVEKAKAEAKQKAAAQGPPPTEKSAVAASVNDAGRVIAAGAPLERWPDDQDVPVVTRDAETAAMWWRDFAPAGAKGLLDAASDTGLDDNDIDLGGPGSGNWAHVGRPGKRGGSAPRKDGMTVARSKDWLARYEEKAGKPHPYAEQLKREKDAQSKPANANPAEEARIRLLAISAEFDERIDDLRIKHKDVVDKLIDLVNDELDATNVYIGENDADVFFQKMSEITEKYNALRAPLENRRDEIDDEMRALITEKRESTLELLYVDTPISLSPMYVTGKGNNTHYKNKTIFAKSDKRRAAVQDGMAVFQRLVAIEPAKNVLGENGVYFRKDSTGRSSCGGRTVNLSTTASVRTVVHELGHWLEHTSQYVKDKAFEFYNRRTQGEATVKLSQATGNKAYKSNEVSKLDKFTHPYMGKVYLHKGKQYATEIISMGLQLFYQDPVSLAEQDPEYFDFIYSVVRGL